MLALELRSRRCGRRRVSTGGYAGPESSPERQDGSAGVRRGLIGHRVPAATTYSVIPFDDEAIAAANDTEYGLAGSIWTENLGRAHRLVNELRGGQIWVNSPLAADPAMPICGHKQSEWGGERGRKGLGAYFNTKSVYISH
jgi:hypothetical protein